MSKRTLQTSNASAQSEGLSKYSRIVEDDNRSLRKYVEKLEEVAEMFKVQNAQNSQAGPIIRQLDAFSKLIAEVDISRTLAGAVAIPRNGPGPTVETKLFHKLFAHYGFKSFIGDQLCIMKALGESYIQCIYNHQLVYSQPVIPSKQRNYNLINLNEPVMFTQY